MSLPIARAEARSSSHRVPAFLCALPLVLLAVPSLIGCAKNESSESTATEPVKAASTSTQTSAESRQNPSQATGREGEAEGKAVGDKPEAARGVKSLAAKPTNKVPPSPGDPEAGEFTLAEATAGLKGDGKLVAEIVTELGTLTCDLYEDKAPLTVANFVGLARGKRAWKKGGEWVTTPLYNGTTFHRVIKTFMVQGGDPNGNGSGGPGYAVPDEIWEGASHSEPGLLCMANAGPDTNGSQFFILNNASVYLDGGYTIFGKCKDLDVLEKIASVPVRGDRAVKPPVINKIDVKRVKD
ncbi:MAG: hypothetical protein RJA70_3267 [Pseudomonadota bacterium]|jgi:peptidyl-prolyl cis-trans isomerase A (cyclophilin A)